MSHFCEKLGPHFIRILIVTLFVGLNTCTNPSQARQQTRPQTGTRVSRIVTDPRGGAIAIDHQVRTTRDKSPESAQFQGVTRESTPTPTSSLSCSINSNLGSPLAPAATGTLSTRLNRGGVQGTCGTNTLPGNTGTGPFPYDAYTYTNPSSSPVCVTASLTVNTQSNANYQIAAFRAPFAAADITNSGRYLGDPGISSATPPESTSFQFTVPGNTSFVIIVFSINGTTEMGGNYSIAVSQSVCGVTSQLEEGFDNVTTLIPAGWAVANNSQPLGTQTWFQGNTAVFSALLGAPTSYIGANYNSTSNVGTISNWLMTKPLTLQNGTLLTFFSRIYDPQFADRVQVRASMNGDSTNVGNTSTSVGDFSSLLLDINPTYSTTGYPNVWTPYTVWITGAKTATPGRLAFRYFVENGGPNGTHSNYLGIDSVQVSLPPPGNAIDISGFFVTEHYLDFLNRQPDPSGLTFWTNNIENCGSDSDCRNVQRINTSAAYFLSIEFQQTGYLVERLYKAAFGDANGTSTFGSAHQISVPVIRFSEFLADTQQIGQGVVVGQTGWETQLENNKQSFASQLVQRSRFTSLYPTSMTPDQFVDALNTNAGSVLSASERTTAINLFGGAGNTSDLTARAQALRQVAEDPDLFNAENNRAFVLMQFFGYLRRDPNSSPDTDYSGFDFWLTKLNQFGGNYINAEMVKAFISSTEYRGRF